MIVMTLAEPSRIADLTDLARDSSPAARARLATAVSEVLLDRTRPPTAREQDIAVDILRHLIVDADVSIRQALARRLAREPAAPRALVVALANDEISVARPLLLDCVTLDDGDLIEIIHHRTLQHQMSIAARRQVSESVSAALVSTGNVEVMRVLVENRDARIGRRTFERLVEQSRAVRSLQAPLIARRDLEPDLAARMYVWASAALRREIVLNFDVDPKLLDHALADALDEVVEGQSRERPHVTAVERKSVSATAQEDPGVLLRLLRAGEVAWFEAVLARKNGLRLTTARRAFYEPGGRPLAVACRAIGVDKADFAAIFLLARQARPGDKSVDRNELHDVLAYFDQLSAPGARQLVDAWRTDNASPAPQVRH